MDKVLSFLGLAKKAGRVETGEEPVGAAARARTARLILLAQDAADNTARRAKHFAETGRCPLVTIPADKATLGAALGRTQCAMAAVTEIGFAAAAARKLAEIDPARCGETAEELARAAARADERRRERERHEKNVRTGGKKRTVAAQKPEQPPAAEKEKAAVPQPRRSARSGEHGAAHEKRRNTARKRADAQRFASSRPVKKGKGSGRRGKP